MTEKLYDNYPYESVFTATVLSCEKSNENYVITLNRTLFFPEEGGQCCDTGTFGNAEVIDVQIKGGIIYHTVNMPLEVNTEHKGEIDFKKRYRNMQNHSGEHIVSGVIHNLFGLNNVGFHLGSGDVTVDFDGILTREQLNEVENICNRAIYENIPIIAEYPENLSEINYRSKIDLTENVRIVTIKGYDVCACCAPHVKQTGEIGIIKLTDFAKYKNGVRIHLKCGFDALLDYREKYENVLKISNLLCVKQNETAIGVQKLLLSETELSKTVNMLKTEISLNKINDLAETDGNLCIFENTDTKTLQKMANEALKKCGKICAAFSGDDQNGYSFVLMSENTDLQSEKQNILSAIKGNGGGNKKMLCGKCKAEKSEILRFFNA